MQAQLTDNSWIINESCRLTGGFAFVTWFRTGQFVLTLGGYHPRFAAPAGFPVVPRLGFGWKVSDIISIKGEAYFALTASCVMAGARLDVSIDAGWIWGRLVAGFDALVAWDPFFYEVEIYASVSVGFKIEVRSSTSTTGRTSPVAAGPRSDPKIDGELQRPESARQGGLPTCPQLRCRRRRAACMADALIWRAVCQVGALTHQKCARRCGR